MVQMKKNKFTNSQSNDEYICLKSLLQENLFVRVEINKKFLIRGYCLWIILYDTVVVVINCMFRKIYKSYNLVV